MRRMVFPLMLAAAVACQPQSSPLSDADVTAIHGVAAAIDSAALAGDWDAVSALLTDDLVAMSYGFPTIEGRSAWRGGVDSAMAGLSVTEHTITYHEVVGSGDIAYARGTYDESYVVDASGQTMPVGGRLLSILRKQPDGSWLIAVQVALPDEPWPTAEDERAEGQEHT